jgi:hypothetical protein
MSLTGHTHPYHQKSFGLKGFDLGKPMPRSRKRVKRSGGTSKAASRGFSIPHMAYEEKKFVDTQFSNLSPDNATPSVTLLNTIPAGTGISERIGNHAQIKKVQVRVYAQPEGTAMDTCKGVMLIVYDKQANKTALAATDVLETVTAGTFGGVNSFNKLENRDRFTILKRVEFIVGGHERFTGDTTASSMDDMVLINEYIDVDLPVHYDGTNGTIGEITTGAIQCIFLASNAALSAYRINGFMRVRYEG